jgi:hypothetical protein
LRTEAVIEEIHRLTRQQINAAAALGANILIELAEGASKPADATRLKAATALLDRSGFAPVLQHHHAHKHEHSISEAEADEMVDSAISKLKSLGFKFGPPAKVLEAEYKDVTDDEH